MTIVERGICRSFRDTHSLEAGSAVEKAQNCHIGNYMEGYPRIGTYFMMFLQQQWGYLVAAFLRRFEKSISPL